MLTLALKLLLWNNKNWTQRKQEVKLSFRAKWEKLVSKKQRICNKMSTVVILGGGRKKLLKLFSQCKALPALSESRISKCVVSFPAVKVKPLCFQTLNYHNRPCHLLDRSVSPFLPHVCLILFRLGSIFSFCTFLMPNSFWIVLETSSKKCSGTKKRKIFCCCSGSISWGMLTGTPLVQFSRIKQVMFRQIHRSKFGQFSL